MDDTKWACSGPTMVLACPPASMYVQYPCPQPSKPDGALYDCGQPGRHHLLVSEKGYIRDVTGMPPQSPSWYLPVFPVIKPAKTR